MTPEGTVYHWKISQNLGGVSFPGEISVSLQPTKIKAKPLSQRKQEFEKPELNIDMENPWFQEMIYKWSITEMMNSSQKHGREHQNFEDHLEILVP